MAGENQGRTGRLGTPLTFLILLVSVGIAWGSLFGRVGDLESDVGDLEDAPTVPEVIQVELRHIGERLDGIESAVDRLEAFMVRESGS